MVFICLSRFGGSDLEIGLVWNVGATVGPAGELTVTISPARFVGEIPFAELLSFVLVEGRGVLEVADGADVISGISKTSFFGSSALGEVFEMTVISDSSLSEDGIGITSSIVAPFVVSSLFEAPFCPTFVEVQDMFVADIPCKDKAALLICFSFSHSTLETICACKFGPFSFVELIALLGPEMLGIIFMSQCVPFISVDVVLLEDVGPCALPGPTTLIICTSEFAPLLFVEVIVLEELPVDEELTCKGVLTCPFKKADKFCLEDESREVGGSGVDLNGSDISIILRNVPSAAR